MLFSLIESTIDLNNCIINFVTSTQTIEIVDAQIKSILTLNKYEFINCTVLDGIFENCVFYNCEVSNSQLLKSKITSSRISNSKVLSSNVEQSDLNNCYFMNGYLNGDMNGGVFRSGELGPYASISTETKVVSSSDNFFDTKFDTEENKGDKKGFIKSK